MSIILTFNGQPYTIPTVNEVNWGTNLDDYFVAIAAGCLQKTGGNFTLSADTDFGGAFGLKSIYYKSKTANVASAGQIRLAKTDVVSFRNNINGGDLDLGINASDQLTFNGVNLQQASLVSAHLFVGNASNLAADVAVTGDISIDNTGLTAIGSGVIVNDDVNGAAAIAYSKLNLGTSIVNADISTLAAIAWSKLAVGPTKARVLQSNSITGVIEESGVSNTTLGFLDATSSIQSQLNAVQSASSFYRRPALSFINVTTIDVESNTATTNQTSIRFPDGSIRSVIENTAATSKYRRFIITEAAEFTAGTENSGLRSPLAEATNTWYALYAVKSLINAANFVLVGDTTLPLQVNIAALNGFYGVSGWIYLGMIRNGDNSTHTGDLLSFSQSGNQTCFINNSVTNIGLHGIVLATSNGANSISYAYSAGTGATNIPDHITCGSFLTYLSPAPAVSIFNVAQNSFYFSGVATSSTVSSISSVPLLEGISVDSTPTSTFKTITLSHFIDSLLN